MNAAIPAPTLMSAADYRESLRRLQPAVYVDGRARRIGRRRAGVRGPASTRSASPTTTRCAPKLAPLMTACAASGGKTREPA